MKGIFVENDHYNLRSGVHIFSKNMCIATVSNIGSEIWNMVPEKMKNAPSQNGGTQKPKNVLVGFAKYY